MSKHWRPDFKAVPLRPRGRRAWTRARDYVPGVPRRRRLPDGAFAGLVLLGAACVGIAVGVSNVTYKSPFVRPAASSSNALAGASLQFGFCHTGGGTNCVVDGDTFYINGDKVRIAGIDAPETHPPRCAEEARLGEAATQKLQALLNSGAVTMTSIDRDRDVYGRLLRDVQVDGEDVGGALVGAGVAREYGSGRRGWC